VSEDQLLIERFALVDGVLAGFQDPRPHPLGQFYDLLKNSDIALILLQDLGLLGVHVGAELLDLA
jgi:hypothetical protein